MMLLSGIHFESVADPPGYFVCFLFIYYLFHVDLVIFGCNNYNNSTFSHSNS